MLYLSYSSIKTNKLQLGIIFQSMLNIGFFKVILLIMMVTVCLAQQYCGNYNCYELLGVERDADQNTIKKAFRQMAKKYHPDKNQKQDTTQLFQVINKAYQILTDQKSRFKYNLHLENPEESDFYHEYRYYSKKYIQDPQIHPSIVVVGLLTLVSILQYVMRKQMYQRAILHITESHDFKTKVNQRCGNNKKIKDQVKEEMVKQIQIEGGYSKPQIKDMLICKLILLPYNIYTYVSKKAKWIYKYNIKKYAYSKEDQQVLTIKAMDLTPARWETIDQAEREALIRRKLWVKENLLNYREQMKQKWLQQLKINNPNKYKMVVKHMAKNK